MKIRIFVGYEKRGDKKYKRWFNVPEELNEYVLWMIDLGYSPRTIRNYVNDLKAGRSRGKRSYERFLEWKKLYDWSADNIDLDRYQWRDRVWMKE